MGGTIKLGKGKEKGERRGRSRKGRVKEKEGSREEVGQDGKKSKRKVRRGKVCK